MSHNVTDDLTILPTKFGYITLWSAIWPLSPVMGFVNNFFEIRSDAAKICLNTRRPIPARAESIGPWLEVMVRPFVLPRIEGFCSSESLLPPLTRGLLLGSLPW